jgi:preprotein translocase subunit SecA
MNLKVVEQTSPLQSTANKQKNMSENPKCLLILKKDEKISRNDRCEATGKNLKIVVGLYKKVTRLKVITKKVIAE